MFFVDEQMHVLHSFGLNLNASLIQHLNKKEERWGFVGQNVQVMVLNSEIP